MSNVASSEKTLNQGCPDCLDAAKGKVMILSIEADFVEAGGSHNAA
jgi:hypothetical protein